MIRETKVRHLILAFVLSFLMTATYIPQVAFAAEDDSSADKKVITGFAELEDSEYYFIGNPDESDLTQELPETIKVNINGAEEYTTIPVTWQAAEDVDDTGFYFYCLNPVWSDEYVLDEGISPETGIPWVTVYKELSEEEEDAGETAPELPVENEDELEQLFVEEGQTDPNDEEVVAKVVSFFTEESYAGTADDIATTYKYLTGTMGLNMAAACGVMTNLYAESGIIPNNLENTYNKKYDLSDAEYTAAVNKKSGAKGKYTRGADRASKVDKTGYFTKDYCGYGICQWTSLTRRANLYAKVYGNDTPINDLKMQLGFLDQELEGSYKVAYATLKNVPNNATGVYLSAAIFCKAFEVPADTNSTSLARANTALSGYWKTYSGSAGSTTNSHLGLCGYTYPTAVKEGKGVAVSGYAISNYSIKSITCKITTSGGTVKYSSTKSPNANIYALSNFDSAMKFSALDTGSYKYTITAKDSYGKTVTACKSFKVASSGSTTSARDVCTGTDSTGGTTDDEESTLEATGYSYPTTFEAGTGFAVKGTVKSNYKITSVTGTILNSSGKSAYTASASPNAKSYDLSKFDSKLLFSKLAAGEYKYQVIAKDAKVTKTLFAKEFTVTEAASKITAKNYTYPKTLKKGKSFTIKGTVSSNYKITKLVLGVYKTNGAAAQSASASVNAKTYKLSKLDSKIKFGKLAKGTYYYRCTVTNTKETKRVINKTFTVK